MFVGAAFQPRSIWAEEAYSRLACDELSRVESRSHIIYLIEDRTKARLHYFSKESYRYNSICK